jgi:DNA polymerase III delta prime subunit
MKKTILLFVLIFLGIASYAQNFKATQREQEKTIKAAYKKKKITELEYEKLMREQEVIKQTMEKYEVDKHLDPHEKNVLHDKLGRAERRLKRYKTNSERY